MTNTNATSASDREVVRRLKLAVAEQHAVSMMKRPSPARRSEAEKVVTEWRTELGKRLMVGEFDAWEALGFELDNADRRERGAGSCYFDKARQRWIAEMTVNGRRTRRVHLTREGADAWLADGQERLGVGQSIEATTVTVAEWMELRLAVWETPLGRRGKPLRPATMRNHRHAVDTWWKPNVGDRRLVALQRSDVERVMGAMNRAGLSPNSVRINTAPLMKALNDAILEGHLASNVAKGLSPSPERKESDHLNPDEARRLLAGAPGQHYGAAVAMAMLTGMRRGELLGLAWDRVELDTDEPHFVVDRQLTRDRTNGGAILEATTKTGTKGKRTIPLAPMTVELLRSRKAAQAADQLKAGSAWSNPDGLVFTTGLGTPIDPDTFTKATYSVSLKVIGRRVSPHALRHTAASLLADAGVSMKVAQAILGHTTESMTSQVYTHTFDHQLVAGMGALDASLRLSS